MTIELSDKEITFIRKALIHSANIHVAFCNFETQEDKQNREYPIKETEEYARFTNALLDKIK